MNQNNATGLVGIDYSVNISRCKTKGNITEHWTGKTFMFWLDNSNWFSSLYKSEIHCLPEEVVDMLKHLGHPVPEKFTSSEPYTKEIENV